MSSHNETDHGRPHQAIRLRFSLLALFLFVTLACVLLAWWVQPRRYIVESLFHLSAARTALLVESSSTFDPQEFERLRNTHTKLIRSDFVLIAALRDPQIAALPVLKSQPDQVQWLRDKLEVPITGDSELTSISLRCPESAIDDCRSIVDAVSDAYLKQVVFAEDVHRLSERDAFTRSARELEEKLRHQIARLKELTEKSGPDDPEVAIQRMQVDALSKAWQEVLFRLEVVDVNAAAQSRVRQVQKATVRPE